MISSSIKVCLLVIAVVVFISSVTHADKQEYVDFNDELIAGKTIWLENCEGCHGYGIAGAPIPMQVKDWSDRLQKPKSILYEHAINGFFGPEDTQMPARGGNPELSDEQVKSAVDYMTELATYYLNLTR